MATCQTIFYRCCREIECGCVTPLKSNKLNFNLKFKLPGHTYINLYSYSAIDLNPRKKVKEAELKVQDCLVESQRRVLDLPEKDVESQRRVLDLPEKDVGSQRRVLDLPEKEVESRCQDLDCLETQKEVDLLRKLKEDLRRVKDFLKTPIALHLFSSEGMIIIIVLPRAFKLKGKEGTYKGVPSQE